MQSLLRMKAYCQNMRKQQEKEMTTLETATTTAITATLERATDSTNQQLSWDEVYKKMINLIKFASKQVAETSNGGATCSAEDLFQEGQLLLYKCFEMYKHKSFEEFSYLFKSSMWRKLRDLCSRKQFTQVDVEEAYELGYDENTVEDIYQEYKLQQIESMLQSSPIALAIFKEVINPSKEVLWQAEMDIARKTMLKEQGHSVAIPRSLDVKLIHIQRALNVSNSVFKRALKHVKQCLRSVYQDDIVELQLAV